jgi:Rad3-related DNA helicase
VKKADIVFMPYNYLLDSSMRRNFSINLAQSIIIIDEAHNVA